MGGIVYALCVKMLQKLSRACCMPTYCVVVLITILSKGICQWYLMKQYWHAPSYSIISCLNSTDSVTYLAQSGNEILKYGIPDRGLNARLYENHVLCYDQAKKTPVWVAEHITKDDLIGKLLSLCRTSVTNCPASTFQLCLHAYSIYTKLPALPNFPHP